MLATEGKRCSSFRICVGKRTETLQVPMSIFMSILDIAVDEAIDPDVVVIAIPAIVVEVPIFILKNIKMSLTVS